MKALISDPDQSLEPLVHVSAAVTSSSGRIGPGLLISVSCTSITSLEQFRFIHTLPFYPSGKTDLSAFYVHLTYVYGGGVDTRVDIAAVIARDATCAVFTSDVAHYSHPACQLMVALSLSIGQF